MGFSGAAHGWGIEKGPLPKTCHTYPTKMKFRRLYLTYEGPKIL